MVMSLCMMSGFHCTVILYDVCVMSLKWCLMRSLYSNCAMTYFIHMNLMSLYNAVWWHCTKSLYDVMIHRCIVYNVIMLSYYVLYDFILSLYEVIVWSDKGPQSHSSSFWVFVWMFELCTCSKSVFTVSSSVCSLVPLIYILKPLPVLLTVKKADKAILEILPS